MPSPNPIDHLSGVDELDTALRDFREHDAALHHLTCWQAGRESYQARALRRSLSAIARGMRLDVHFRTARASLEPHLEGQLRDLAAALRDLPGLKVHLTGYADTRGSRRFNRRLALRRVHAVWTVLAGAGVPVDRMRLVGGGEGVALYGRGDRGGHAFDRRVVVSFALMDD